MEKIFSNCCVGQNNTVYYLQCSMSFNFWKIMAISKFRLSITDFIDLCSFLACFKLSVPKRQFVTDYYSLFCSG